MFVGEIRTLFNFSKKKSISMITKLKLKMKMTNNEINKKEKV